MMSGDQYASTTTNCVTDTSESRHYMHVMPKFKFPMLNLESSLSGMGVSFSLPNYFVDILIGRISRD